MLSRFDQRSLHLETGLDQNFLGTTTWWLASKIFILVLKIMMLSGATARFLIFGFT